MEDDVLAMYLEDLKQIDPLTEEEEKNLLAELALGNQRQTERTEQIMKRLVEGNLCHVPEWIQIYVNRGLGLSDLIAEANAALFTAVREYREGDITPYLKERISQALEDILAACEAEQQSKEEIVARVNVLQEVSARMSEEMGRQATVSELADKMMMTEDEIRELIKMSLNAVNSEYSR